MAGQASHEAADDAEDVAESDTECLHHVSRCHSCGIGCGNRMANFPKNWRFSIDLRVVVVVAAADVAVVVRISRRGRREESTVFRGHSLDCDK